MASCGACGEACANNPFCLDGVCSYNLDFGEFDADVTNGYETDIEMSHDKCGECGRSCRTGGDCYDGMCFANGQ